MGVGNSPHLRMATDIDICNLALSQLGEEGEITGLNPPDGSEFAAQCSRYYPVALRKLFEEFDWGFAQARFKLNELSNYDKTLYSYAHAYALPSDCVRVVRVSKANDPDKTIINPANTEFPKNFEVMYSRTTDNRILLTNVEDAIIQYTMYKNAPALFPTYFIEALVLALAVYLVGPLKRSDPASQMATNLRQAYEQALNRAKTADAANSIERNYRFVASQLRARWV